MIVPLAGSTALTNPPMPRFCQSSRSCVFFASRSVRFIAITQTAVIAFASSDARTRTSTRSPTCKSVNAIGVADFKSFSPGATCTIFALSATVTLTSVPPSAAKTSALPLMDFTAPTFCAKGVCAGVCCADACCPALSVEARSTGESARTPAPYGTTTSAAPASSVGAYFAPRAKRPFVKPIHFIKRVKCIKRSLTIPRPVCLNCESAILGPILSIIVALQPPRTTPILDVSPPRKRFLILAK